MTGETAGPTDAGRGRLTGAVARGTSRLVDLRERRREVAHPARATGTSGTFDSLRQAYAERLDLLRRHASLPELEANAAELAELEQQVRAQAARRHWRDPATYLG